MTFTERPSARIATTGAALSGLERRLTKLLMVARPGVRARAPSVRPGAGGDLRARPRRPASPPPPAAATADGPDRSSGSPGHRRAGPPRRPRSPARGRPQLPRRGRPDDHWGAGGATGSTASGDDATTARAAACRAPRSRRAGRAPNATRADRRNSVASAWFTWASAARLRGRAFGLRQRGNLLRRGLGMRRGRGRPSRRRDGRGQGGPARRQGQARPRRSWRGCRARAPPPRPCGHGPRQPPAMAGRPGTADGRCGRERLCVSRRGRSSRYFRQGGLSRRPPPEPAPGLRRSDIGSAAGRGPGQRPNAAAALRGGRRRRAGGQSEAARRGGAAAGRGASSTSVSSSDRSWSSSAAPGGRRWRRADGGGADGPRWGAAPKAGGRNRGGGRNGIGDFRRHRQAGSGVAGAAIRGEACSIGTGMTVERTPATLPRCRTRRPWPRSGRPARRRNAALRPAATPQDGASADCGAAMLSRAAAAGPGAIRDGRRRGAAALPGWSPDRAVGQMNTADSISGVAADSSSTSAPRAV